MFMLKYFAEGLLTVIFLFSFIFLVVGNMSLFKSWIKDFEKKKRMRPQYYYLKFWGDSGEYTKEELEELHHKLEQFEKENNTNC